jgi:hypothetical protein
VSNLTRSWEVYYSTRYEPSSPPDGCILYPRPAPTRCSAIEPSPGLGIAGLPAASPGRGPRLSPREESAPVGGSIPNRLVFLAWPRTRPPSSTARSRSTTPVETSTCLARETKRLGGPRRPSATLSRSYPASRGRRLHFSSSPHVPYRPAWILSPDTPQGSCWRMGRDTLMRERELRRPGPALGQNPASAQDPDSQESRGSAAVAERSPTPPMGPIDVRAIPALSSSPRRGLTPPLRALDLARRLRRAAPWEHERWAPTAQRYTLRRRSRPLLPNVRLSSPCRGLLLLPRPRGIDRGTPVPSAPLLRSTRCPSRRPKCRGNSSNA